MTFSKTVFADELRMRRLKLRMSQDELAKASGLTADLIWKYENAGHVPGADKVFALAEALGCTPNDLCGWAA